MARKQPLDTGTKGKQLPDAAGGEKRLQLASLGPVKAKITGQVKPTAKG